ncbi:MAG: glycosyltransferase family 2 protein [bacterium]
MKENKLLSICIPTFNRVELLKYNLKSITDQFDIEPSLKNVVEIVISDNASSDDTKKMVVSFSEKYENIIYHRNETNIGFDRNLNNVVNLANGKYCLTLGDDDALFPNSLSLLIKKILNTYVPYYLVGHVGYSRDMQHASVHEHVLEDCLFPSLEDYVRSLDGYLQVIGIFGGMSTHVFLRAFKDKKFMVLSDLIVKTRGDNMRWEDIIGLETTQRRNMRAFRDFLWIKRLYGLPQSKLGAFVYFMGRGYWIVVKGLIKKFLFFIKCDKLFYKLKNII